MNKNKNFFRLLLAFLVLIIMMSCIIIDGGDDGGGKTVIPTDYVGDPIYYGATATYEAKIFSYMTAEAGLDVTATANAERFYNQP